ncbi:hypothetical protein AALP_AA8G185100 [Arabis alpina]|uniref:Uncharacterized protein n=1 Tax=Arabis alpina TaxID=50452 RepID=A0A087G7V7_ARAAL|nr:hypothetical protein AALP_AA8G185100 [Arabis alpina]
MKIQELTDKAKEIVSLKAEARKSAAALLAEAEKSAIALAATEEMEKYSAAIVKTRDGELSKVKAPAVVAHDQTLKTYAASVSVADPSGSLHGGAGSRKAALVSVDGKFSLIGGVGAEVTKSRIEDVAEGAETVGAPEEMRTDEDSQGPRIDALTEDPRLDDVFGETEANGALVT